WASAWRSEVSWCTCSGLVMLRASPVRESRSKRISPPTFTSHTRERTSSLPSTCLPPNPMRSKSPRASGGVAFRAAPSEVAVAGGGSGGGRWGGRPRGAGREGEGRASPSPASCGSHERAHAVSIHPIGDHTVALQRGAHDEAVGEGEQVGGILGRGAAAHDEGHVGNSEAHALEIARLGRETGSFPGDDQPVGPAAVHAVPRLVLDGHGGERCRVLGLHVGEEGDRGIEETAIAKRLVRAGGEDALVGDHGARVHVHADEACAYGGSNGEG